MQTITPFLWFEAGAEDAVKMYTSAFPDSAITTIARYSEMGAKASRQKEGTVMTVAFKLAGQDFVALNGGAQPYFNFTPAISFFVNCNTAEELDTLWAVLSDGGTALMPVGQYPFSQRFGWLQDKFGVSWQLNLGSRTQKIVPALMFTGDLHGHAEEAMRFYVSVFENSAVEQTAYYGAGEFGVEGTVKQATFHLRGRDFKCMDSNGPHKFGITGAISFVVSCTTQQEIDRFWDALTTGGRPQPCGWLQDRYGVAWQIVPAALGTWMQDPQVGARVMAEVLKMQKIDLATLERAAAS